MSDDHGEQVEESLKELVGFMRHANPQIRQLAIQGLVPYSNSQPLAFKIGQPWPVEHLKVLIQDHPKTAEAAATILVNLSTDGEVLQHLATDDKFLDAVLARIVSSSEANADLLCMLLANLAKSDTLKGILDRKQPAPDALGSDDLVINQLVNLFVKGADGTYNSQANYDYLAYLFADLAKHAEARQYFVMQQSHDGSIPLTKLKVFTEHKSDVRRKGVANTIKNVAFDVPSHPAFLDKDEIDILPYILLPITGNETYDEEEMMAMLPDLQLLPPEKQRDPDPAVILAHVETLTLLASTRQGRDLMRDVSVYPVIRETHLRVNDDGVREACERLVQVLMRDEEDGQDVGQDGARIVEAGEDEDEDERIVEV